MRTEAVENVRRCFFCCVPVFISQQPRRFVTKEMFHNKNFDGNFRREMFIYFSERRAKKNLQIHFKLQKYLICLKQKAAKNVIIFELIQSCSRKRQNEGRRCGER